MDFKDRTKLKIAISKIRNEEKAMKKNNIYKIATVACLMFVFTGVAFAAQGVIEKIWKTPEIVQKPTTQITEESKKENITEEQAKEIAVNKLEEIGFNSNIISTNHYKDIETNEITYRFINEDNYEISIKGKNGEFYDLWNQNKNIQDRNILITADEAIEKAKDFCILFGYNPENYLVTEVNTVNDNAEDKSLGFRFNIVFSKKQGNTYNPYDIIAIAIESKNKDFAYFRVDSTPFENNEILISKEEAIQIALNEDAKIITNKVTETKAVQMVVKMNSEAYKRIKDKEQYYDEIYYKHSVEERDYYKVDEKIRNAWVVVITYEDTFGEDDMRAYTEGQYSYFVDCTTGEIIGGHVMDYTYKIK